MIDNQLNISYESNMDSHKEIGLPQVFDYTDYRQFLSDYCSWHKQNRPGSFSFRNFARVAGISKYYLSLVMSGKRNLGVNTIHKFSQAMKLKKAEGQYFENLVLYAQTTQPKEKDHYFERLLKLRPLSGVHVIDSDSLEYFSNKYLVMIREMTALSHFKEDYRWIAARLHDQISPAKVKEAIEILIRLGFLNRDNKGRLLPAQGTLKTFPSMQSLEYLNYHRSILEDAKNAIIDVHHEHREIIAQTISLSRDMVPEIRKILQKCQEDIAAYLHQTPTDNLEDVYQINVQFYPVTKMQENDDG